MFKSSNEFLTGQKNMPTTAGCELVAVRFAQPVVSGDLTANNINSVGILPAGCVPVALIIDADKLDSGTSPALVLSFGVSNAAVTGKLQGMKPGDVSSLAVDGGAAWAVGIKTAQQGGQEPVYSKALSQVKPTDYDRYLVLKVTTAAAATTAGEIGVTLVYRQA